jgi:hypothetical protein
MNAWPIAPMTDAPETLLSLPLGTPGAGRIRYGAAMALYQQGHISPAELEAWRIASASDTRPVDQVLAAHGLPAPRRADPTNALTRLMQEAAAAFALLRCPGAAELRRLLAHRSETPRPRPAQTLPVVTRHLEKALFALRATHPALATAITTASPQLHWQTPDSDSPDPDSPAICTLLGGNAPFPARDAEFGLCLIAPHGLHRDHSHPAPELYLPLTGPHGWRFGPDRPLIRKPALVPIWIDAHRPHLIKAGATPFLALYGRTRDAQAHARTLPASDWPALRALRLEAH